MKVYLQYKDNQSVKLFVSSVTINTDGMTAKIHNDLIYMSDSSITIPASNITKMEISMSCSDYYLKLTFDSADAINKIVQDYKEARQ